MKVSVIPSLISKEVIESVDIANPTGPLQIEIRDDQKVLWINDGNSMCIVRICGITGGVTVSQVPPPVLSEQKKAQD